MSYENTDLETIDSATSQEEVQIAPQEAQETQQQDSEESHQQASEEEVPDVFEEKKDILIIKGRFKFQSSGIYGIFAILFRSDTESPDFYNSESNPFISFHIIVSYFSDIFQIDLQESWETLEETFNKLEIGSDYATTLTSTFQRGFTGTLANEEIGFEIVADFKNDRHHSIEREIDRILTQAHKDVAVNFELFYEEADGRNIESIRKLRIEHENPLSNEDTLSTPSARTNPTEFYIPASPILAPVGEGIASNQLSPGIRIMMRVNTGSSYGMHWVEYFKLYDKETKTYLPIVGTIDQIGPVIKNCLDIVVKYQNDQHTKFNIESGIKLKLFNPHSDDVFVDPLVYREDTIKKPAKTMSQLLAEESFRNLLAVGVSAFILAVLAWVFIH